MIKKSLKLSDFFMNLNAKKVTKHHKRVIKRPFWFQNSLIKYVYDWEAKFMELSTSLNIAMRTKNAWNVDFAYTAKDEMKEL